MAAKRDRSPRPTVGTINCPEGHSAEIKKQVNGILYSYCDQCQTKYTYDGTGGQDWLLKNGKFKGAADQKEPEPEPKQKTVSVTTPIEPEKKPRRLFDDDPDLGI